MKNLQSNSKKYKLTVFSKTLLLTLALLVIAFLVYRFFYTPVGKTSELPVEGITRTKLDRFNILLVGTDQGGLLTDTIMVANIDTINGKIKLASIPRDTMVEYKGRRVKINSLLSEGKGNLSLLVQYIKDITGIEINNYTKVTYLGFRNVIDILDGVEIDVKQNMYYSDPGQNLKINIKKGLQVMNGKTAEGYVRYRATYRMGDMQRTEVQREFIKQLIRQKLNAKYIAKGPELLKELYKEVETNFVLKDALTLVSRAKKFDGATCLETIVLPGTPEYVQEVSYYICDEPAAEELFSRKFSLDPEDNEDELTSSQVSSN